MQSGRKIRYEGPKEVGGATVAVGPPVFLRGAAVSCKHVGRAC